MLTRRSRVLVTTVAVGMVVLVGCGDDDGGTNNQNNNQNTNENQNTNQNNNQNNNNQLDPITPGGCGLAAYDWLPTTTMGTLVSYEEDDLSPVTAEDVEGVLAGLNSALVPVPYGMRLYRIRYVTQDKGQQVEATAMVGMPWNESGDAEALPVALWHHGTTGFTGACAPSDLGLSEIAKVGIFTAHGYITAAPDYIGLDPEAATPPSVTHAYLGIEQTGIGSLDALRATYELVNEELGLKITASDDVVLWGASQGGHGAFATNLIAPYYAPEFDIRAMVASVPSSDLTGQIAYSLGTDNVATPYAAVAMVTMHTWYEGTAPFTDVFTNDASGFYASQWTDTVFTNCGARGPVDDATELDQVFTAGALAGATGTTDASWTPWACYFEENSIATSPIPRHYDTPTLFVTGELDDLVDITTVRADYDRLCGMGYRMEYLECSSADHMDAALWSLVDQIAWVKDRLDGVPLETADICTRTAAQTCSGEE